MKRVTRSLCRALLVSATCAAATAPAAVADDIPRPPGAIDNRGYELVSPAGKNQNPMLGPAFVLDDGSRALYSLTGPVGVTDPSGVYSMLMSTRTDDGWTVKNVLPPADQLIDPQYLLSAVSSDMGAILASSLNGVGLGNSSRVALAMLDGNNGQQLLYQFPRYFGLSGIDTLASHDLRHLIVAVPPDIDPSLPGNRAGVHTLYDFGGGTPELVGVLPSTGLAPACGMDPEVWNFARPGQSTQAEHWVSTDGSRAFFATRGDTCTDPLQLYMRDLGARTTTLISGPPFGANVNLGVSRFLQAAANGSWAIFTSQTSYVSSDDSDANSADMDVYRWSAATRTLSCLTCIGVSVDVLADTLGTQRRRVVVSEDGSHVYFSSAARFADAPTAADSTYPNTYLWRQGQPLIRFVSRTSGVTPIAFSGGYVTPNGKVLIFQSDYAGLNLITAGSNGGTEQFYRYSSEDGSVTCLSCPTGGVATRATFQFSLSQGIGSIPARARPASDDGSMVFFPAFDALVPEDVNNDYDIYEWHDGVVRLITNGVTDYPRGIQPFVATATPDGSSVFFVDNARLTADAEDDQTKLYVARVDGGFSPPPTPQEPCHGDCRGPPTAPPVLPGVGSGGGADAGNVEPGDPGSFTVSRLSKAQRTRAAERGRVVLHVSVSGPGGLEAFAQAKLGKRIRPVARRSMTVDGAGPVRVVLRLSKAARTRLADGKRVRLVVAVNFADALESKRLVVPLKRSAEGGASRAARRASVPANADGR